MRWPKTSSPRSLSSASHPSGRLARTSASFSMRSSRDTWSAMSTNSLTRRFISDPPRPRGVKYMVARIPRAIRNRALSPGKLPSCE